MICAATTSTHYIPPHRPFLAEEEPKAISIANKIISELDALPKGAPCEFILNDLRILNNEITSIIDQKTLDQINNLVNTFSQHVARVYDTHNPDGRRIKTLVNTIHLCIAKQKVNNPDLPPDEQKKLLEDIISLLKDILPTVNQFSLDPASDFNSKLNELQLEVNNLPAQIKSNVQDLIDEFKATKDSLQKMQDDERTSRKKFFAGSFKDYIDGAPDFNALLGSASDLNWGTEVEGYAVSVVIGYLNASTLDKIKRFVDKIAEGDENLGVKPNPALAQRIHQAGLDAQLNVTPINMPDVIWGPYFGIHDIVIPPQPAGIDALLDSPCPIHPDKKVKDTHVLRLMIQQTAQAADLTINRFLALASNPRQGTPAQCFYFDPAVKQQYGDASYPSTHWILITRELIPQTTFQTFDQQTELVKQYSLAGITYALPTLLEAVACSLSEYVTNGSFLFQNACTRCQERLTQNGYEMGTAVGQNDNGFYIKNDMIAGFGNPIYGAAGVIRFED